MKKTMKKSDGAAKPKNKPVTADTEPKAKRPPYRSGSKTGNSLRSSNMPSNQQTSKRTAQSKRNSISRNEPSGKTGPVPVAPKPKKVVKTTGVKKTSAYSK